MPMPKRIATILSFAEITPEECFQQLYLIVTTGKADQSPKVLSDHHRLWALFALIQKQASLSDASLIPFIKNCADAKILTEERLDSLDAQEANAILSRMLTLVPQRVFGSTQQSHYAAIQQRMLEEMGGVDDVHSLLRNVLDPHHRSAASTSTSTSSQRSLSPPPPPPFPSDSVIPLQSTEMPAPQPRAVSPSYSLWGSTQPVQPPTSSSNSQSPLLNDDDNDEELQLALRLSLLGAQKQQKPAGSSPS